MEKKDNQSEEKEREKEFSKLSRTLPHILRLGLVLFCLALLPYAAGYWPAIRFVKETIAIDVFPRRIEVQGDYYYQPRGLLTSQGFSYPIPRDKNHPQVSEISVYQYDEDSEVFRSLPLYRIGGTYRFQASFSHWGGGNPIRVTYTQVCKIPEATYLLTTTKPWGRPLQYGKYILRPRGVIITDSSYPLQWNNMGEMIFERRKFMPPRDWTISWKVEDKEEERPRRSQDSRHRKDSHHRK